MIYTIKNEDRPHYRDLLSKVSLKLKQRGQSEVHLHAFPQDITFLIYVDYDHGISGLSYLEQNKDKQWSLCLVNLIDNLRDDQQLLLDARFTRSVFDTVYLLAQDSHIPKVLIHADDLMLTSLEAFHWPLVTQGRRTYLKLQKTVKDEYDNNYRELMQEIMQNMSDTSNVIFLNDWKELKEINYAR